MPHVSLCPPVFRGLHSSTFRLNLIAFCGIGVHSGVVLGGVHEVSGATKEYQGVFRVYFVSETAQVELRSGRVRVVGFRFSRKSVGRTP